jgi:uncharacterized protein YceK
MSACTCGCGTLVSLTTAEQGCECGCECCTPSVTSTDEEVAQLKHLRDAAEERLAELGAS